MAEERIVSGLPYFDRQERIEWWSQSQLSNAHVLVVGAGALGNEVLKNLSLLGVGHILVIDFDTIEDSNLSRTVLFRTSDAADGASKAIVAARRARDLNPNPRAIIQSIQGNVVWELGSGIYRHVDLVIGCLDNTEARLAVNLGCWQAEKTWIDGGIWELSGSVAVYDASRDKACYECGMTAERYRLAKVRYSCTNETVKAKIRQGHEPTTQTTSAVIAAIQSQEAVKLLHSLPSFAGRQMIFNGASHFYNGGDYNPMTTMELTLNPACLCHSEDRFEHVLELDEARASETTARQLIAMVEANTGVSNLRLELGRTFVVEAICSQCNQHIDLRRPLYRVRDIDAVCPTCKVTCPSCGAISEGQPDCPNCGQADISELRLLTFHTLSAAEPEMDPFLDYTLANLGIPPLHIVRVLSESVQHFNVELTGDLWPL